MEIPKTQLGFGYERGKFEVVRYDDLPVLEPNSNEILLRVEAAGLCLSDIHTLMAQDKNAPPKFILGHEIAGSIAKAGSNVAADPRFQIGTRYSLSISIACGSCKYCRGGKDNCCDSQAAYGISADGGFQQFLLVKNLNTLLPIPEGVSYEQAAVASDSILTPMHAVNKVKTQIDPTAKVLVLGLGGLGLNAVQILKNYGCTIVACDVKTELEEQAKTYGATEFYTDISKSDHMYDSFDVCFDFCGFSSTFVQCQKYVAKAGSIVLVGLGNFKLTYQNFVLARKEVTTYANFGGSTMEQLKCNEWIKLGKVEPKITIANFEELPHYFMELAEGKVNGRIVFRNNDVRSGKSRL